MKNWVFALVALLVLVGCKQQTTNTLKEGEIISLDQQVLPNSEWQLSRSVIELSFCRDRVNEDLLASESELRGWRGSGEPTAFPPYREEGLEKLAELLSKQPMTGQPTLLWQKDGNVSAQRYHVAMPANVSKGELEDAVFPLVAFLSSSDQVCHVAVDDFY
ncbi:hypothetical protein [Idiomarina piscisalsi]|uniref:Lipoprotein n=1 Tax=Idiomarina piscisalsi TaxID=1096243 RepID=A0A432YN56_9GAMM|nr:hypothetical protein [Idiomarina piscisalsi]RUO62362.1 hypothetical protein CWI73_10590 [Idiomarina piscisalsi]